MLMIDDIYEPTATTVPVLRYVVAIAAHGHFGRAAEACGIAQPTLSAQIRKWEQRLGLQVFERGNDGSRVTEAGRPVVARAREALAALAAVEEAARGGGDPLQGDLRCGMIPTVAPYLLPHLLPSLERDLPGLSLDIRELQTGQILRELQDHRLDCAILARLEGTQTFASALCYDEDFWLACPHDDPMNAKERIGPGDLLHDRMLLLQEGHCFRDQALDLCGARADHPQVRCQASSLDTLCQLVAAGYGCTLLPALAIRPDETRFHVRRLSLRGARRQIDLIWRPSDPRSTAFHRFAKAVHSAVSFRPSAGG
jgi:LysR family hydrogen peroxide-inducible transcriptional activator